MGGGGEQQWSKGHIGGLPGTAQAPAALQSPLASIPSEIWNCISVERGRREGEEVRGGREERMRERGKDGGEGRKTMRWAGKKCRGAKRRGREAREEVARDRSLTEAKFQPWQ